MLPKEEEPTGSATRRGGSPLSGQGRAAILGPMGRQRRLRETNKTNIRDARVPKREIKQGWGWGHRGYCRWDAPGRPLWEGNVGRDANIINPAGLRGQAQGAAGQRPWGQAQGATAQKPWGRRILDTSKKWPEPREDGVVWDEVRGTGQPDHSGPRRLLASFLQEFGLHSE